MRKVLYILLTVLAGLLLSATTVYAVGGRFAPEPPDTVLLKGERVIQKGHYGSWRWHVWSQKEGRWYFRQYTAEEATWPTGDRVKKGELLRLAFYRDAEPTRAIIKVYHRRDMTDKPETVYPSMDTVWVNGEKVGWALLYRPERTGRQYTKSVIVWERTEGRHYSYGRAVYYTHVFAR